MHSHLGITGFWHTYPEKAPTGLWSTAEDLSIFMVDLMEGWLGQEDTLLNTTTVEEMLTQPLPLPGLFGLGPRVVENAGGLGKWFDHGGR